ncbi:COMM domain-containing protein 3-like isoform X1 [Pseudonaja textilis]|uniref:COMM domain-containing protein 3 n=1 Tax=Pseudonaja textilis TaxID=8673 RepID=A0A670ZE67_PSETE|nr:COMM domain-containing protein 3-like isoform X1 [Pseudonaja textilis]
MEVSDPVQSGLQILAEPSLFSVRSFQAVFQGAFQSLFSGQTEQAAFDYPDLEHIDPAILKYCHTAATTYIIEAGKQKADKFIIRTHLEDFKFNRERIEHFCTEYQIHKDSLEIMLGSIGRCPLHVTDVCWRLEYQIKINQLHKNYCPAYLMTLRVENIDSRSHEDINFSCSMEQLQDLVGKLKDAAKSLERKTQL